MRLQGWEEFTEPVDRIVSIGAFEAFKAEPSVLLGTSSFWEGVDVQGDRLSLVIIDKLPFASPADPLIRARSRYLREQGGDPFRHFSLPQAAINSAAATAKAMIIRTRRLRRPSGARSDNSVPLSISIPTAVRQTHAKPMLTCPAVA